MSLARAPAPAVWYRQYRVKAKSEAAVRATGCWPLQDILSLKGVGARINTILCNQPSIWVPHSPPSSPTLLRNILYLPEPPCIALQYIS